MREFYSAAYNFSAMIYPLIAGAVVWLFSYLQIAAAMSITTGVLSQVYALIVGAAIGLGLALWENRKKGWKSSEAIKNMLILIPLCAAMTSFGWIILQGWAGRSAARSAVASILKILGDGHSQRDRCQPP